MTHLLKIALLNIVLFSLVTVSSSQSFAATEELKVVFDNPSAQAKPFARWWWNGSHRYKISNAFDNRPSELKILYTSTLINEMIAMKKTSKTAAKWTGKTRKTKAALPQQQGIIGSIQVYRGD